MKASSINPNAKKIKNLKVRLPSSLLADHILEFALYCFRMLLLQCDERRTSMCGRCYASQLPCLSWGKTNKKFNSFLKYILQEIAIICHWNDSNFSQFAVSICDIERHHCLALWPYHTFGVCSWDGATLQVNLFIIHPLCKSFNVRLICAYILNLA